MAYKVRIADTAKANLDEIIRYIAYPHFLVRSLDYINILHWCIFMQ